MTVTTDAQALVETPGEDGLVLPLSHADAQDPKRAGGKAARLAELLDAGFDVPGGFVVTVEACRTILQAGGLGADSSEADVRGARLPEGIASSLQRALQALGPGKVAVRSSAVGEDGGEASFAGVYETTLGAAGADIVNSPPVAGKEPIAALYYKPGRLIYRNMLKDGGRSTIGHLSDGGIGDLRSGWATFQFDSMGKELPGIAGRPFQGSVGRPGELRVLL